MAAAPVFSSLRRRRLPLTGAFFAPVDLADLALIHALANLSAEVLSSVNPSLPFQRRNSRSLLRKVRAFLSLFESLKEKDASAGNPSASCRLPSAANLCFKELYILLYRSKILLEYCSQSSRLWLLLRNTQISGHFHDLTMEVSTLLDVLPLTDLNLPADVREQVELLQKHTRLPKLYLDPQDEALRQKIYAFLSSFEKEAPPDPAELREFFTRKVGIRDARTCRAEIEFLEEQIYSQEEEVDPSVLDGVVALVRYCRFLLFGFGAEADYRRSGSSVSGKKGVVYQEIGDSFVAIPKDFTCPISLDLMRDPVIVSTGQTYDRSSITRWMDEGHSTCPNSGQMLTHKRLVPNRALRSLISQWCVANYVVYDPPEASDASANVSASKAAVEANKATTTLLVRLLSVGSEDAKATAAHELRLLAKTAKENRACIADAGAIPYLIQLLSSTNPIAQENSVTAILNLSIHEKNKARIMEEEGCLRSIVDVLINGLTMEARENAAAALFSLSAVHDYKKWITDEDGAVEALARLLRDGTPRGKKDAVTALFNLSTHMESCERMVTSGAASALVEALRVEGVAEEAAGALALLVRQKIAAEAVARDDKAVSGFVGLMRRGSPKGKENAVAALVEMCRSGGAEVTGKVAAAPAIGGLIQTLMFTGTKRARRKAASLMRLFQRHEATGALPYQGWAAEFAVTRSRSIRRVSVPSSGDVSEVSVSVPVPISVPVL